MITPIAEKILNTVNPRTGKCPVNPYAADTGCDMQVPRGMCCDTVCGSTGAEKTVSVVRKKEIMKGTFHWSGGPMEPTELDKDGRPIEEILGIEKKVETEQQEGDKIT